jgi:hypothetical protein
LKSSRSRSESRSQGWRSPLPVQLSLTP